MMPRPVRARRSKSGPGYQAGDHYTTTRYHAEARGDEVLEGRKAVDAFGRWLPDTPKSNLEPVRDDRGRFTTDEPTTGEEEA